MVSSIQKGIKAQKIKSPPGGQYLGVDLSKLPKYVCYKAALLREKLLYQQIAVGLLVLLCVVFSVDRYQISKLTTKLRDKEYIVLPDHIPVSPHSVSDQYIQDAVRDILQKLGSVNANSIDGQYSSLLDLMRLSLKRRFEEETFEWKEYVKNENITEVLTCPKIEIISDKMEVMRSHQAVRKKPMSIMNMWESLMK